MESDPPRHPGRFRLGELISTDRNTTAAALRDILKAAFQEPNGDWLPAGALTSRHRPDQLLLYARALTDVTAQIGHRYAEATEVLRGLPVKRHDPTYQPVFPVGTDLAKAQRERWLPLGRYDPDLRQVATRARLAASQTDRALEAIRDTALDTRPATGRPFGLRPEPTMSLRDLRQAIATLDAMIPAAHINRPVNPGSRPAWANGATPPESLPDIRRPGRLHEATTVDVSDGGASRPDADTRRPVAPPPRHPHALTPSPDRSNR